MEATLVVYYDAQVDNFADWRRLAEPLTRDEVAAVIRPHLPGRELAIGLWDLGAQKELGRVKAHRGSITALAFSPDGKRLLSASEDATALVWDVAALIGRGDSSPLPVRASMEGRESLVPTTFSEPNR